VGVRPAKNGDFSINSVAVECYISELEQTYENQMADAGTFCASGPRVVVANNNWGHNISGPNDFGTGAYDDTIWGVRSSTGFTAIFRPTGASGAGSTPEYSGTEVLRSYNIRGSLNGLWTHNTQFAGNSSLARDAT
jgi:hypothetical protein